MKDNHGLKYEYNEHQALKLFDVHTAQKTVMNVASILQLHGVLLLLPNSPFSHCHMIGGHRS